MLSVVIVNYNAGTILVDCLTRVCQSATVSQIILVDNGSSDHSMFLVRQKFGLDPRLCLLENGCNLGFSRANNQALKMLSPENRYILFLNPDCLITGQILEKFLVFMERHPQAGLASCLITNPDGTEQRGCRRRIPTPGNSLGALFAGRQKFSPGNFNLQGSPLPSKPVEIEAVSGSFMFARREAIEAVSGFDEGYFLHCEDLDLCKRLSIAGWQIYFLPDIMVVHYQGTCSQAEPLKVSWHKHCGMERFYRKFHRRHYGLPMYWLIKAAIWGHFILEIPRNLWKGGHH